MIEKVNKTHHCIPQIENAHKIPYVESPRELLL